MEIRWTESQRKVIELSGRNVLVSAAAGSGKTAVLVQRILEKISNPAHPLDIDRLLVVTFTNAAAGEMRERIRQSLEQRLLSEPDNEQLKRQRALMPQAHITTIDSFCLNVVRSYFYRIDLDPSFRIGDEGELKLMRTDVMDEMLRGYYQERSAEFMGLADCYTTARGDQALRDMIERLYTLSQSYPWPRLWLEHCADAYSAADEAALADCGWMRFLLQQLQLETEDLTALYEQIFTICRAENGPLPYEEPFRAEQEWIAALADCRSYREYYERFQGMKFKPRPRRKKTDTYDSGLAERAAALRDEAKKRLTDFKKNYFSRDPGQVMEELHACEPVAKMLIRLALDFTARFDAAKREKNLVDFSDIEHMALRILTEGEGELWKPSPVAGQYSRQFEEILIDEYQDSNYVQEYLLNSISREHAGTPNLFMVGDVKQSIYAFRLAKPELFMEKYKTYTEEDSLYQKVELHQNFRSRSDVLHSVNYLFHQLMKPDLGKVDYTREAALYPGAEFAACDDTAGGPAEFLLLNRSEKEPLFAGEEDHAPDEDGEDYLDREWEAGMTAERILKLTDPEKGLSVWDKQEGQYRKARFGDIVILLRSMSGWAEPFARVLSLYGIPAQAESRSGYFSALEVRTVLNLLQVLDNPAQDIPLTSVLHSAIVGMNSAELAEIKNSAVSVMKDGGLYSALLFYHEHYTEGETARKAAGFLQLLNEYRKQAVFLPLHELLRELYDATGYYDYVSAMPGGARRKANLDMLIEKAVAFEGTSYSGLFQFVRYIERLEKYEVDFGEASLVEEQENTVRIMSIHKSKGLEFPVVFVCGTGKRFNRTDAHAQVVLHPDFGIGLNVIDGKLRLRSRTLIRQVFQLRLQQEAMGEELRILYVALTRAKEKLIMTGCHRDAHTYVKARMGELRPQEEVLSFGARAGAASYLDWLLPAMLKHMSCERLYRQEDMPAPFGGLLYHHLPGWETPDWSGFDCRIVDYAEIRMRHVVQLAETAGRLEGLTALTEETGEELPEQQRLREIFEFPYQYGPESGIHAVMSVTEIKKRELLRLEQEEGVSHIYAPAGGGGKQTAAARGTATHLVLQQLSFREGTSLEEELIQMRDGGLLSEGEETIAQDELEIFWQGPLAKRMKRAAGCGKLWKEVPFVIGVLPEELEFIEQKPGQRLTGGRVLVQGIIDAFFEEDGALVLVDYKTDRLPRKGGAEELARRYRMQLRYYKRALADLTGKPVKQSILYSFCLGKEIPCRVED